MTVNGIERIGLYTPRFAVNALKLAEARGRDPEVARDRYLLDTRSVAPPYEDAVTLAVNAAGMVLGAENTADVGLVIVATESSVDFGKPVSSWVQRYCGLPRACRNFEIKHACYAGTAALKMALAWLGTEPAENAKALVVSADLTRPFPQDGYDFAGGAVAVALLVSARPEILEIDGYRRGVWAEEVADTFRPTAATEMGDNQTSLCSYLDALDGAYDNYRDRVGDVDYEQGFAGHIYHAPFPGMTWQAHRSLLARNPGTTSERMTTSFEGKVKPGLHYARLLGTAYGASNFVCLLGLLRASATLTTGDRISLYSYGSGCQAEFYDGVIGARARDAACLDQVDRHISDRREVSIEEFEAVERARQKEIDQPCFRPLGETDREQFEQAYCGRHWLVLDEVRNFRRHYLWS